MSQFRLKKAPVTAFKVKSVEESRPGRIMVHFDELPTVETDAPSGIQAGWFYVPGVSPVGGSFWRPEAFMSAHEQVSHDSFVSEFYRVAQDVHYTAVSKGWWTPDARAAELQLLIDEAELRGDLQPGGKEHLTQYLRKISDRNDAEMLALLHSEISEGLEGLRNRNPPDDKVPEFSSIEAELADVIIRIMDLSVMREWRVAEAIIAKMKMNATRPERHGGKLF